MVAHWDVKMGDCWVARRVAVKAVWMVWMWAELASKKAEMRAAESAAATAVYWVEKMAAQRAVLLAEQRASCWVEQTVWT